ncbi:MULTISPECIES: SpoVR family protein [unclassified Oleiphilus]|jgi:stage V sporulation protein R|nr:MULTISPECIES: SpoVR family protein [unclassified Oleiphilus]KZY75879.1 SpoVR family protein [Oleiphilus sp. HI0068]KZY77345.1 SpoVR family protein [Oleiphilus sp. HI0069]KZY85722.1 SpoVR family protein [Oleiphilus sp. HI0072]KZZ33350.1 SpoVR family protein [Oleiphilus sp. HI0085]KZY32839.1 SpoVR family protein [Oleiphilus sp. HI0043]
MTDKDNKQNEERKKSYIATGSEWSFEQLERFDDAISDIAKEYKLDTYPNQIEVISSEQMLDAYSSVGMPLGYYHWSYGKQFLQNEKGYKRGQMGLAYEIVINSNPCIAYLMEENTLMMQALVIAHASYGHNSFFKGNYLFRTWTDASAIIDYLLFAKNYIAKCEGRYGVDTVETFLDSCHAVMNYGVDRYKRPAPISAEEELKRQEEREFHLQQQVNELWRTIPVSGDKEEAEKDQRYPEEPQENLLYFFEKNAPMLAPWQREVLRIVRKIAQYFYPQRQTQVMNEGWASFWHYTIMNTMYDKGLVNEGFIIEFLKSHTAVVYQPPFDSQWYSGINPYTLGFAMFQDIKRICQQPTDEDRQWFPDIAGTDWLETLDFAMRNFKDESFILQFLSPKVIRDLKLFAIRDDDQQSHYEVTGIHDEQGYRYVREKLSQQYNLSMREPDIQVWNVDLRGDRSLTLRHTPNSRVPLGKSTDEVLKHIHRLWGFDVHLFSVEEGLTVDEYHCPPIT